MSTTTSTSSGTPTVTISEATLRNACNIAIKEDKPIMLDYYMNSLNGTAVIGVREGNEKMLVKSADEYTSTISKTFKCGNEYIVQTENSIYIVSSTIPSRKVK
jgi:response regulator of citrate/malate metabolism